MTQLHSNLYKLFECDWKHISILLILNGHIQLRCICKINLQLPAIIVFLFILIDTGCSIVYVTILRIKNTVLEFYIFKTVQMLMQMIARSVYRN